jgi:hypothetical protein
MLAKGMTSLSRVAEVAAATAASTVRSGSQRINQSLQEQQVAEVLQQNARVVQERAAQVAQVGRGGGRDEGCMWGAGQG